MNPGELRHRITLQKFTTTVNENGFEEESWIDFKILWASVSNLHGREYFEAAAVQKENTVKFIVRYIKDLDTSMKIMFKGKSYNIIQIDNIRYENRFVEIKAMEVDSLG
jgi:SPP1 family predicted phage head-tail adaptor